jgi:hypothetical protein
MMPVYNIGVLASQGGGPGVLLNAITGAGLTSNLELCLDATSALSYPGGDTWLDVSGHGMHFYRGSGSGSDSTDPTFNGSIGGSSSSDYFSTDGADYFSLVSGANPTWVENMHKAGAAFSLFFVVYCPPSVTNIPLFSTEGGLATIGFGIDYFGDPTQRMYVENGASFVLVNNQSSAINVGAWNIVQVSIAAGVVNGSRILLNGTVLITFTATYTSPSASAATYPAKIFARGNVVSGTADSGTRLAQVAGWSSALSAVQSQALTNIVKPIYGIS